MCIFKTKELTITLYCFILIIPFPNLWIGRPCYTRQLGCLKAITLYVSPKEFQILFNICQFCQVLKAERLQQQSCKERNQCFLSIFHILSICPSKLIIWKTDKELCFPPDIPCPTLENPVVVSALQIRWNICKIAELLCLQQIFTALKVRLVGRMKGGHPPTKRSKVQRHNCCSSGASASGLVQLLET